MTGERNLKELLSTLSPSINFGTYVFATVVDPDQAVLAEAIATVREREGVTLVLEKGRADELRMDYNFVSKWITLQVHSSLEAVGLTHAVSGALTESDIPANVVAGHYHDHIFVPVSKVDAAVRCRQCLARTALND